MEYELALIISYVIAVSLLTITPGVDTAIIVQACFSKKNKSPVLAAMGILLGCATWGLLVAFGLGAIITSNTGLYLTLKTIGAVYLIWIGLSALLKLKINHHTDNSSKEKIQNFLRKGFLANLLNPKVGLFYLSLLPQFIPTNANVLTYSMFLVAIHIILSAIWFWLLTKVIRKSHKSVNSSKFTKIIEMITGVVFIGFGLKLLAASR